MILNNRSIFFIFFSPLFFLSACSNGEQNVPMSAKEEKEFNFGSLRENTSFFFKGKESLFDKEKKKIWKNSHSVLSVYPIIVSDFISGVISTDWFEGKKLKNERFKLSIHVTNENDKVILSVKTFKQTFKNHHWIYADEDDHFSDDIRNKILSNF